MFTSYKKWTQVQYITDVQCERVSHEVIQQSLRRRYNVVLGHYWRETVENATIGESACRFRESLTRKKSVTCTNTELRLPVKNSYFSFFLCTISCFYEA